MVGTGKGAEETDTGTHVEEAAPEVLEEAITIDVRVRVTSFRSRLKVSLATERDRRDHRYDDRRDSERRDRGDRRGDDRRDDRHRDDPRDREVPKHFEAKPSPGLKEESGKYLHILVCQLLLTRYQVPPVPAPRVQSEGPENSQEEGESMEAVNQDDEAMMVAMGITGFGSTKVCGF